MSREIKPEFQPVLANKEQFLAPLQSPVIQDIVRARGVDAGVSKYFFMNVLHLYLFAGTLKGFYQPLRGVVGLCGNWLARWFSGLSEWTLSGLSDVNKRISHIVYKEIYEALSKQVDSCFSASRLMASFGQFKIFDATYLRLCLKLMPWGRKQNRRDKKGQMLASFRIDEGGRIPDVVLIDSNPTHCETHFERLINWAVSGFTYLFDRGYRCIETLTKIHHSGNFFITRWNKSIHITVTQELFFCRERRGDLEILHDQRVRLGKGERKTGPLFRLITALYHGGKEPTTLYILTNRFDLCPFDAADIYRYRWEIESFFKWLKSCLKLNHFFTYSENGVYAQIYITLILNLLLAVYHKNHKLTGRMGINTQRAAMNSLMNLAFCLGMRYALHNQAASENAGASPPSRLIPVPVTYEIVNG